MRERTKRADCEDHDEPGLLLDEEDGAAGPPRAGERGGCAGETATDDRLTPARNPTP